MSQTQTPLFLYENNMVNLLFSPLDGAVCLLSVEVGHSKGEIWLVK